MALTMTRTRNQTTLNKLAFNLAEVNGELAFLARMPEVRKDLKAAAEARRAELEQLRGALCVVIRRYDPELDPDQIGESYEWLKAYGRKATPQTVRRYFGSVTSCTEHEALGISTSSVPATCTVPTNKAKPAQS